MAAAEWGVSFIVPVCNKAPYLPAVLAAIRAQRGDFPRQYIFIDDGSTDGSAALLDRLTAGWPDTVVERQVNRGSAHATNRAIALARLPFLKFVDADDLIAHDATRVLLEALAPSDACLAFGGRVHYPVDTLPDLTAPLQAAPTERLRRPLRLALRNSLFNPTQCLARTEAVRAVGGCDERIVWSQEYTLTLRLARRWDFLKVDTTVAYLPREVPGRLSNNPGRQLQRVTLACANFLRDHPDTPAGLKRFACHRAAGRAWKYARRHLGATHFSSWFGRALMSRLGVVGDPVQFIEACAQVYERAPEMAIRELEIA
ncbi:MAG TPA: glycosyltransferase family 2 protein [Alphaproteobacteria bacterium]